MPHTFFASVIDLSHYGEKYGENHIYTRQTLTMRWSGIWRDLSDSQIHPEVVIAPGYNWGISADG